MGPFIYGDDPFLYTKIHTINRTRSNSTIFQSAFSLSLLLSAFPVSVNRSLSIVLPTVCTPRTFVRSVHH